jgi:hypothetical protein
LFALLALFVDRTVRAKIAVVTFDRSAGIMNLPGFGPCSGNGATVGVHPGAHSLDLLWCQCPIAKQAFHALTLSQALLVVGSDWRPIGTNFGALVSRTYCGASHERQHRKREHSKPW